MAAFGSQDAITSILTDLEDGDRHAAAELLPIVYEELRRLAARHMRGERPDHTLQTTALVHEAYMRLVGGGVAWQSRAHFFRVAATTMRRILVNHAKKRDAIKRGGGRRGVVVSDDQLPGNETPVAVLDMHEALNRLAEMDAQKARLVELRFFGGCTIEETAEALEISTATVERDWRFARAWLHAQLRDA